MKLISKVNLLTTLIILLIQTSYASEATGFYSRGKLIDAENIISRSGYFQKLFISRGRLFSTNEMNDLIINVSINMRLIYPNIERLQIGDLSAIKGGKITRHKSHQNGLDADLVYYRKNNYVQPSTAPEWEEEFVKNGKVTSNFNLERNWTFVKQLYQYGNINRIFIDKEIKKLFCSYLKALGQVDSNTEILRHLRPLPLHKTHLHLRINCPSANLHCIKQAALPLGSGC